MTDFRFAFVDDALYALSTERHVVGIQVGRVRANRSLHHTNQNLKMPHSEVHGDDLAIIDFDVLVPPGLLRQEYPLSQNAKMTITKARNASADVITGEDDRVV